MSVPLVRLSSLDLIRGFVAVGRRMSITQAADDLCLTQSAVSRQIRALEEQLGVTLLERKSRGVQFTPAGERLFRSADGAVQQLQDVVGEIRRDSAQQQAVTISASIGISGLWLLPRLGRLQQAHPDIEVRLSATNEMVDMSDGQVDLALRYCSRSVAPAGAVWLFGERVVPVAHPTLGIRELKSAEALGKVHLLEFDDSRPWLQWRPWLRERGWQQAKPRGVVRFNQYDQVIHAALAGQGIALARLELVRPLIDNGQLIAVTAPPDKVETPIAYWLIRAEAQPREQVRRVAAWIEAEAAAVRGY
ncbi:LysR substrate-binding domain-containing protein [Variovorax sp. J22R133]|uniref:LysR substrate-binding domain-containing protein n=1 Tax=Variovorax brevis TaxID=3053503 RepID=UPI002577B352|nr:LysR substrate-binding domain-containing protein [Variovorax sp. J22R133]MDM0117383.1 LysR substrate-binding domain-containing protein [Variovorax sp. J22R133]